MPSPPARPANSQSYLSPHTFSMGEFTSDNNGHCLRYHFYWTSVMNVLQWRLALSPRQEDRGLDPRAWGLSVCCLHVLPVHPVRGFSPSTSASKGMQARWTVNSKLAVGVSAKAQMLVSKLASCSGRNPARPRLPSPVDSWISAPATTVTSAKCRRSSNEKMDGLLALHVAKL